VLDIGLVGESGSFPRTLYEAKPSNRHETPSGSRRREARKAEREAGPGRATKFSSDELLLFEYVLRRLEKDQKDVFERARVAEEDKR
jgi:hypothetical protein